MTASSGSAARTVAAPMASLPGRLVVLRAGSAAEAPVLCVHAAGGDVSLYEELARGLRAGPAVLGVCPPAAGDVVPGPAPASPAGALEQLAREQVSAIRAVQPDGPYRLVGECSGGVLAYEIARQLQAAGERVSLLALIDALPLWEPPLRRFLPRGAYRTLHRGRILATHAVNLVRLGRGTRGAYARAKARRARAALAARLPGPSSRTRSRDASQLERAGMKAAFAGYRPAACAARGVLFRASRLPWGLRAGPDLGWAPLLGELEMEVLDGYFTTAISEPGVHALAERISRRL
jgi:thioesterase domain-containing protein